MPKTEKIYAVLTGDLVKSSRLSSEMSSRAMGLIKDGALKFAEIQPGSVIGKVDTFRFDGWQLLLGKPELALHAALFLRSILKMESNSLSKFDTRVSIGIGPVESIVEEKVSDSRGAAFTVSGKALDSVGNKKLEFSTSIDFDHPWKSLEKGIVPLLDCVVSEWTPPESRAVYGALMGWTQEEAAGKWPRLESNDKQITRQAVADSLTRANWHTVETTLKWVNAEIHSALTPI